MGSGSKQALDYSSDSADKYSARYLRNSKAIGVLWAVFTVCYGILSVVVLVQPQWVGDTADSPGSGYFGLWRHCVYSSALQVESPLACAGRLTDLSSIVSAPFRAATIFVGLAVIIALLCIICFLMFCFLRSSTVFHLCAWMQLLSGICLLVALLVFPVGWDAGRLREVCGPEADKYHLGRCGIRWAYMLAIVGAIDALVLAALGFVLSSREEQLWRQPEPAGVPAPPGSVLYEAASVAGSRRSMNLQPVMLMPQLDQDRYSEFSQRSAVSARSPPAPAHNFHL
ncbi:LHFPL tetraspan subfamily member 3 protein-like [Amphibalanus amphitrite]|uniref:LHFPL tetraspan subfamily member 3 protein-like n=1 Tax=Amphibalanus amphitrite TaxID=1232801 RepID=UPI001C91B00F|nr:LHFPL tetraspan subfamily member 3 protein-like [Amphibalanus amphitrite]XP_043210387.1 LHFPL tetraspan subfamily member 3 protein-like [Amphibalanus amphitrite]